MKAKIIANIVIIAGAILLFIWWVTSIPFSDSVLWSEGQNFAVMVSIWSVGAVAMYLAYKIIKWVNKR